ncbi:hypothetical protein GCM10027596_32600 [Nocardioides korecus]
MRRAGVVAAGLTAVLGLAGCASTGSRAGTGGSAAAPSAAGAPADDARQPSATPAPTGGPRGAVVDPARLRHGADPRLPWWDATTSRLHDGRLNVRVTLPGSRAGDVVSLDRAGSAYLLVAAGRSGPTAFRVGRDGRTRVLARTRSAPLVLAVAANGRTFAWLAQQGPARATVVVSRTSDGAEVARQRFRDEQLRVLTLTPGRALVGTYRSTASWDLATGTVRRVLPDTGLLASRDGARLVAARAPDDTPAFVTGPATSGPWSLPRREVPQQLNPDGRLLLSGTPHDADPRGYDVFLRPLVVRDASTGRVRARFDGRFGWYDAGGPRWEDGDHVLAIARAPGYASGQPTIRLTWVRCTVSTRSCETAGPPATLQLDVPPYVVLPRLVAAAPAS